MLEIVKDHESEDPLVDLVMHLALESRSKYFEVLHTIPRPEMGKPQESDDLDYAIGKFVTANFVDFDYIPNLEITEDVKTALSAFAMAEYNLRLKHQMLNALNQHAESEMSELLTGKIIRARDIKYEKDETGSLVSSVSNISNQGEYLSYDVASSTLVIDTGISNGWRVQLWRPNQVANDGTFRQTAELEIH